MDWFTADTHAFHDNIVRHCNRPFSDGEAMAEKLAEAINDRVMPGDTLYHLGDVAWPKKLAMGVFREMLNCRSVILIRGNHDDIGLNDTHKWFAHIKDRYRKDGIEMSHTPQETWMSMHSGIYHLHGHCHGMLGYDVFKLRIDVGVDCLGYRPISRDEVEIIMQAKIRTRDILRPHWEAKGYHFFGL